MMSPRSYLYFHMESHTLYLLHIVKSEWQIQIQIQLIAFLRTHNKFGWLEQSIWQIKHFKENSIFHIPSSRWTVLNDPSICKKWILLFLLYSVKSYLMRGNFAKIQVFSSRLYLLLCLNGWVSVSECASAQANIRRNDTKQIIWFVSRTSSTFISNKTRNECTYSVCMLFMASNVPFASDWILLS